MEIFVMGLGYVGTVVAAGLAHAGNNVIGVDINAKKIRSFSSREIDVYESGLKELIIDGFDKGHLQFKILDEIEEITANIVVICVGTPSRADGAADLSQIFNSIQWVKRRINRTATIIMKSTVPPGTGNRIIDGVLKDSPVKISYIANPEFLREGQAVRDWFCPDKVIIGGNDTEAIQLTSELFNSTCDAPVLVTDTTSAELIKYAANAFLATKISFINEIANLCDYLDADVSLVANGIGFDPRIGPGFLKAGIGYGGSCFPKDVRALDFLATLNGYSFELLRAVININNRQRVYAVQKIRKVLGPLAGKVIAVLGLAFKPGTDDVREAAAIDIIRLLTDEGAIVNTYDPAAFRKAERILSFPEVHCHHSVWDAVEGAQAILIATEWEEFINLNWTEVKRKMEEPYLIIDGRNCLNAVKMIKLGFRYSGIGRYNAVSI